MTKSSFSLIMIIVALIIVSSSRAIPADAEGYRGAPAGKDFETLFMECVPSTEKDGKSMCQVYRQEIWFDGDGTIENVPSFEHPVSFEGARNALYDDLSDACHENFDDR